MNKKNWIVLPDGVWLNLEDLAKIAPDEKALTIVFVGKSKNEDQEERLDFVEFDSQDAFETAVRRLKNLIHPQRITE